MKKNRMFLVLSLNLCFLLGISMIGYSQNPPPPPGHHNQSGDQPPQGGNAPLGGGIAILLLLVSVYGTIKAYASSKKENK